MLKPIAITQIPQISPQSMATLLFASTTFGFFALRVAVRFFAGEDFLVVVDFCVRLGELSGIEWHYFSVFFPSMQTWVSVWSLSGSFMPCTAPCFFRILLL